MGILGALDTFCEDDAVWAALGTTGTSWIIGESLGDISIGCLGGVLIGAAGSIKGLWANGLP